MLDKLTNSWQLVKASAAVLEADKELMVLPLISGAVLILVSASFFVPVLALGGWQLAEEGGVLGYAALFVFYLVQYTVIFFFNSALVGAAMIRLEGGDPTVGDGLAIAWRHRGAILGYAAIAATVGVILRTARERAGGLSRLVVGLVGLAWNLATFLVVPVLVTRDVGPIEAIKESSRILKRTWGEQIAGNVGIGFVFGLLFLLLSLVAVPTLIFTFATGQPALIAAVVAAIVVAYLLLALVQATLSGIYQAALYRFATAGDSGRFDGELLQGAFRSRG